MRRQFADGALADRVDRKCKSSDSWKLCVLLIIVFYGYENFGSKLSIGDHEDRPAWMGKVHFSDLKMKLISAIASFLAVELLKAFLVSTTLTGEEIGWKIAIHRTFVCSGLLFAASDWISDRGRSA